MKINAPTSGALIFIQPVHFPTRTEAHEELRPT